MDLNNFIKEIKDFPKQGIIFKDMTPLLADNQAFRYCIDEMVEKVNPEVTHFAGIESRGFVFAAAMAQAMGKGLVLVRKPGKLPREVVSQTYDLEYGSDELQVHKFDLYSSDKIVIVDDVLATGGTAKAAENLFSKMNIEVIQLLFLMEIKFLQGGNKLTADYESLLHY